MSRPAPTSPWSRARVARNPSRSSAAASCSSATSTSRTCDGPKSHIERRKRLALDERYDETSESTIAKSTSPSSSSSCAPPDAPGRFRSGELPPLPPLQAASSSTERCAAAAAAATGRSIIFSRRQRVSHNHNLIAINRKVWSANLQGVRRLHGLDAQTSDSRR
eukprot:1120795-Prymnesium_polylepis.2